MLKSSYILGISSFYHDSSAALIRDGEIIAAAQEERFVWFKRYAVIFYLPSFLKRIALWLKQGLWILELIRKELGSHGPIYYSDHLEFHTTGTFPPLPFKRADFLNVSGVGRLKIASYGVGNGNKINVQFAIKFLHPLNPLNTNMLF